MFWFCLLLLLLLLLLFVSHCLVLVLLLLLLLLLLLFVSHCLVLVLLLFLLLLLLSVSQGLVSSFIVDVVVVSESLPCSNVVDFVVVVVVVVVLVLVVYESQYRLTGNRCGRCETSVVMHY